MQYKLEQQPRNAYANAGTQSIKPKEINEKQALVRTQDNPCSPSECN